MEESVVLLKNIVIYMNQQVIKPCFHPNRIYYHLQLGEEYGNMTSKQLKFSHPQRAKLRNC